MEKQIREFQGSLSSLLNHIDASTQSLTHHLDRPGVPLDSASASFLGRLGSRVGSAGNDLDRLQSAAFGSLSFEELLGHCREVWKVNRRRLGEIDERLAEAGYVCEIDDDAESEDFELDLGQVDCRWTEVEVCSTERLEKYNMYHYWDLFVYYYGVLLSVFYLEIMSEKEKSILHCVAEEDQRFFYYGE